MGKTERRNVSQKKRSPVRTTLKLRKEKKMKGGELNEPLTKAEIDNIKNRNKDGTMESILALVKTYVVNMNEYGYIIEKKKKVISKKKINNMIRALNNMIRAYFHKEFKKEDFSKNYKTYIISVITRLRKSLLNLNSKEIPPTSVSTQEEYNKHTIQNVKNFITIMKAIAEGAEIKIPTEVADTAAATTDLAAADDDESAAASAEERSNMNKGKNTYKAADASTGKSGAAVDASTGKSGAAVDASTITPTIVATGDGTNITAVDTNEMIDKLKRGLDIIDKIFNSGMGMARNDENELFEKLKLAKRVINAYLIYIDKKQKIKLKKFVDDGKLNTLFFTSEDNESLLKDELIITETDIMNARDRLSQLNSDVNNSLKNKVIDNSKKYSIKKPEYVLKQDTFKQKINFLINLLNEIESKVKKESQDTTSETKDTSNESTANEIKEINDIIIDSDKELVTLNITDQEGHIIYSYILRFTRESKGVTIANGSGNDSDKKMKENVQVTNVSSTGSDSGKKEDTTVSSTDSDKKEVTNVSSTDSDSDSGKKEKDVKYFGGRDPINDKTEMPTTVLTAEINKQFSINGSSFIISN